MRARFIKDVLFEQTNNDWANKQIDNWNVFKKYNLDLDKEYFADFDFHTEEAKEDYRFIEKDEFIRKYLDPYKLKVIEWISDGPGGGWPNAKLQGKLSDILAFTIENPDKNPVQLVEENPQLKTAFASWDESPESRKQFGKLLIELSESSWADLDYFLQDHILPYNKETKEMYDNMRKEWDIQNKKDREIENQKKDDLPFGIGKWDSD